MTYTRMRPGPWSPVQRERVERPDVPNEQDRWPASSSMARGPWVSESRFGWNRTYLARLDEFFNVKDPVSAEPKIGNYGRRVGSDQHQRPLQHAELRDLRSDGRRAELRSKGQPHVRAALHQDRCRWVRQTGNKMSPQNPKFTYQNLNDTLANFRSRSRIVRCPADTSLTSTSSADSSRTTGGSRTPDAQSRRPLRLLCDDSCDPDLDCARGDRQPWPADGSRAARFRTAARPGGALRAGRDELRSAGRFRLDRRQQRADRVRGGIGYLYSPHLPATVRQSVADPYVGFRVSYNRTDIAARQLRWPYYSDDFRDVVLADGAGRKTIFSVFSEDFSAPYTIQSMLSVQRSIGSTMAVESGTSERTAGTCRSSGSSAGVRPADRRPSQPGTWRAGRLLRRQQPDAGLRRAADVVPETLLQPLLGERELHARKGDGHAGRRPGCLLCGERVQHPGFLGPGTRPRAGRQRRQASR